MAGRDEFRYPTENVGDEGFRGPLELPVATPVEVRVRHALAYTEYQEGFRLAYMTKVRARSRGNNT